MFVQNSCSTRICPEAKASKRGHKKFDPSSVKRVLSISYPEPIPADSKKYKKRFKVRVGYEDSDGKTRQKSVYFGDKNSVEYIDHGREELKLSQKLKPGKSVFDKEYYRFHLLNGPRTAMIDNYAIMISKIQVELSH